MSELEDRLNAVLSDPAELQRLAQMASRLMGGLDGQGNASPQVQPPPSEEAPPAKETGSPDLDLGAVSAALGPLLKGMKPKKHPLVEALAPYLDRERRRKLERSMRLAAAAKLAGGALRSLGGDGHGL